MKKIISVICLIACLFTCNGQTFFQTFGWCDNELALYYVTDTTHIWQKTTNNYGITTTQTYHFQDAYSTQISDTNICFLVFPKRWHYNSCCNNGTVFGDNSNPYTNTKLGSSSCYPTQEFYNKPVGALHIPYYNVKITNGNPKYREVIGIGEKTFYDCDSITKITIPSTIKQIGRLFIYGCDMLDTVVFENTFNTDTVYPPQMNDYTWFIEKPITIIVPCNSYDTFYNYIHSLGTPQMVQLNIVPDNICNCSAYAIDTVRVYDTIQIVEIVYDTIVVYDTVIINDTITNYNTVTDTITYTYEIYDTILVTLYDTIIINVYDTLYETIYDTILVFKQVNETFDDLKLYPIPTRDYVNIDYSGGHLNYQLYDNRGKFLESGEVTFHNVVDLTKYASGEYYFKAKLDNGEIVTKKIIKTTI